MKAQIHFLPEGPQLKRTSEDPIQILTVMLEDEYRLFEFEKENPGLGDLSLWLRKFPQAWAETAGIGKAKHRLPIYVKLKPQATPVAVGQYPMPREAREGIQPHIT